MRAVRKPFWSEQWALSHEPPSRGFLMTLGGARHPAERAGPGTQHLGVTARPRPSTRECIGPHPRPRGPTETPKGPQDGPLRAPFSAVQRLRGHLAAPSHAAGVFFFAAGGSSDCRTHGGVPPAAVRSAVPEHRAVLDLVVSMRHQNRGPHGCNRCTSLTALD